MNQTFDTLKAGDSAPTANLDPLINQLALLARAGKKEYGLTEAQMQQLTDRFFEILDAYPGVHERVMDACNNNKRFWEEPSDTVLQQLYDAGILTKGLGVV